MGRKGSFMLGLAGSSGLSVIEVMVAFSVFGLVTTGVVPVILSGLRSTVVSKADTTAKNLALERLETMRNLPFYVGSSTATPPASCSNNPSRTNPANAAGAVECDYKDLLDTYFRSTFPAPGTTVGGYVAGNANRSADEQEAAIAAPFYRYVINPVPGVEDGRYSQVVATQFLTPDRAVVTPPSAFNSQDSDTDVPPSAFLGVTVITRWSTGAALRKVVMFSQIADGQIRNSGGVNDPTTVVAAADATALRVRSAVTATQEILAEAGISRADGSVYNGARAATFAQGAYGQLLPGARVDGRIQSASTPPEYAPPAEGNAAPGTLSASGTQAGFTPVTFGQTDVAAVTAGIEGGQPSVPRVSPGTNFSTARVLRSGASTDFSFTNGDPAALTGLPLLDTSRPIVHAGASGSTVQASGSSYLRSTFGVSHAAESGSRAALAEIRLFPTSFAPGGLVQIELVSGSVTCKTTGTSTAGTSADFDLRIRLFQAGAGYVALPPIRPVVAPAVNQLPDPNSITVNTEPLLTLGNYVAGWTALSAAATNTSPASTVSSTLDGILQLRSRETRAGDPSSAIRVDVGMLSCTAEDRR